MPNLSDYIEEYLKSLLRERDGVVEIQRSELAERFGCAPSQINYVLATRFTPEHGYLVESRRGGGGYIRIIRLNLGREDLLQWLQGGIGDRLSQDEAEAMIRRLQEEGFITAREAILMAAAMRRDVLAVDLPLRDLIRANLFKAMLLALLSL
ncbi:MAG: CtsR family transcriptional regulator [Firmicutes bacterium]|nr:CtsR family transcriptional regulator [Bacillota bacterium]